MFNIIRKQARKALGVALLAAGAIGAPAMATTVSFAPSASKVSVGSSVAVDVRVSDLSAGDDLGAFDFNVLFNSNLFSLSGYSLGGALGDVASFEALDVGLGHGASGVFNLAEISLLSDLGFQQDSFTLATLHFTALAIGNGALSLDGMLLGDAYGNALNADVAGASISVSAVPEAAPQLMLLSGLLLLGLARRQRKQ
jgi:hypothetical protein